MLAKEPMLIAIDAYMAVGGIVPDDSKPLIVLFAVCVWMYIFVV